MGFDSDRFIAGFLGGVSFQLLHPLDVLRVRFQTLDGSKFGNVPHSSSYRQMITRMLQTEGRLALYKGVTFSFFTNMLLGMFFMINERIKKKMKTLPGFAERPGAIVLAAPLICSSVLALLFNPFMVLKTWKLLDQNKLNETPSIPKLIRIIKEKQGWRAFYRGYFLTFSVGLNGSFTVFFNDYIKYKLPDLYETKLGNFVIGGLARLISSTIVYPLTTVRTRIMQNQMFAGLEGPKYSGVVDCFRQTYAQEGLAGFYRGLIANTPRSFLSSGIMFFGYHQSYKWLKARKGEFTKN